MGARRRHTVVLNTPKTPLLASLCACSLLALSCGSDDNTTGIGGNGNGVGGNGSIDGGSSGGNAGGGNAGGGNAGGGNAGGGGGGDGGICSATTVGTGRGAPDMLIVLDRSGSMQMNGVNRWTPSVNGIKSITASLQDRVSFGLMAFPGTGSGGGTGGGTAACDSITDFVQRLQCIIMNSGGGGGGALGGDACQAGSLNVPIAPNNAQVIAAALDAMRPNGATPTAITLKAAHEALGTGGSSSPDAPPRTPYVLLVTDGAPNCTGGSFGNGGQDPQAVTDSVAAIAAMAADGIKTYVLGYGTQNDATLKAALDQMAVAGDTGDTAHRPVEDEASLVQTFAAISGAVLSCDFKLDSAVNDKSFVLVTLDQKQLDVDTPNGWVLGADRQTVTLVGTACETIKDAGHSVSVSVQCDPVRPLF